MEGFVEGFEAIFGFGEVFGRVQAEPFEVEAGQFLFEASIADHAIDDRSKLIRMVAFLFGSQFDHPRVGQRVPEG